MTGTVSWIIGTSGLGAGIDIPNVKVVVHWGIPSDILDWVQMSGCGGRGIDWSYSITIEPRKPVYRRQPLYESARQSHPQRLQMVLDLVSSTECIRPLLSNFLDGNTHQQSCLQNQVQQCWVCTENATSQNTSAESIVNDLFENSLPMIAQPASKATVRNRQIPSTTLQQSKQQSGDVKIFIVEALRRWAIGCTFCHILGKYDRSAEYPDDHTTQTYRRWRERGISWGHLWNRDRGMRNTLKFKPGTCCFCCGCPRSICHQGREGGTKIECTFGKVFLDAVFAASHWNEVRIAVSKMLGQDPTLEVAEFWKNSVNECMWENERCNRMILVALEAARQLGLEKAYEETGYVL